MVHANVVVDLVGTALIVASIFAICCMLLSRAAAKASKQSPVVAFPLSHRPHPRKLLPPSSPHYGDAGTDLSRRHLSTSEMLQNATRAFDQKTASINVLKPTNTNPSYRNPLAPTSPSRLNGEHLSARGNCGIKRTASGIAKVVGGNFEHDALPGSQNCPINLAGASPARLQNASSAQALVSFGEDDFDSDVDLEISEPLPFKSAKYAAPSQQVVSNKPRLGGPLHPTQTRQVQAQSSFSRDIDGDPGNKPPMSSMPFAWSSSPAEHHVAKAPASNMYASNQPTDIRSAMLQNPGSAAQARVTEPLRTEKRRKLPWAVEEKEEPEELPNPTRMSTTSTAYTPASKKSSIEKYAWNTSASAMKEQRGKHRQETKRSIKDNPGTEESLKAAKSSDKRPAKVFLSEEQRHVLNLVCEKKSVFFTGSAGTGKSVLLREIISTLRKKYAREPDRVATTASTGLAACNIGGITLHSFAGFGLGKEDVPTLIKKIRKNAKAKNRWLRTKVLVIDEVSMVDAEMFDKLEAIARQMRANARPFGGIQVVITGDFFQLPPVPEANRIAKFAFDAATWKTSIEYTIGLHHVFRQKDPKFAGMLNEMREGRLSEASVAAFKKLARPLPDEDQLTATELFPTRIEVDRANHERLALLQGKSFPYQSRDGGSITEKAFRDKLLNNFLAPEVITLKKGAQVMLIKNIDETLVNGSIGKVIAFMDERQFDTYNASANSEPPSTQTPNGTMVDSETGQPSARALMMDHVSTASPWPLVRFRLADGTSRDLLCQAEQWTVETPTGEVQASRSQVPLILAWALSIHKAQGQTLDRVKVDLGKVFEKGQAYVALSRATRMEGLQVLRFDPKKVNAHERVRTFYANLSRVEDAAKQNPNKLANLPKRIDRSAMDYEAEFVNGEPDDWSNDA